MRKIYLASVSPARKELLKMAGLKFKILASRIKEQGLVRNLSYAGLVKANALRKAKEAAGKVKSGIIIAADTIAVCDKKIFGKPKDLNEARRVLKKLTKKPQWVYTGVALIDKDKARQIVSYEKTKVYMDKMSDSDIDDYFKAISVIDKAGSFSVQGKGAFFVKRIEGCFYNVVGLPLRKLYKMFKKLGIKLFLFTLYTLHFTLYTFLPGCSTEYNIVTGQEETFYYSSDKEEQIGRAIAAQVENEYKLVDDPLIQKRVEDIGKKIAGVCDRKEISYHFKVLDDEEVNAVSLPGGYVYINKGLIDKVANDDELAAVIGHEIGHIVARHSIKKLQALQGYSILRVLVAAAPQGGQVGSAADAAFAQFLSGYSREDELLADQLGTRYAKLAGYYPRAMIGFLEKLQEVNRGRPLRPKSYFKTHPYVPDRIRAVKQELGEPIDFKDYINIEQETHKSRQ